MSEDAYFATSSGVPTQTGRYVRVEELPGVGLGAGLTSKIVQATDNMMLSFVRYEPHAEAPLHSHVEEQVFVLLEGELEMELGGEVRRMEPGDVAVIPSFVPHRVTAGSQPAFQL